MAVNAFLDGVIMSKSLGEQAKKMLLDNAAAFFLGWILGAGLGPTLWNSILGVM